MKKRKTAVTASAALALALSAAMLLSACTSTKKQDSSSQQSSSAPASSKDTVSRDTSDNSSSPPGVPEESMPASSEEDTQANAIPTRIEEVNLPDLSSYDTSQVTWGPGHQMDEANRPTACIGLQEKYEKYGGEFIMPAQEKSIYLTFDEGYENGYTEKILDVLREKNCPAVFFVTYDYVNRNPELVQRMVDEGHVVGNHSMHHPNMTRIEAEKAASEIADLHNYVAENFNFQMTLFRPPEGAFSEQSLVIAQALGYQTVLWSYAYSDWDPDKQMEPDAAFKKVTGAAHSGAIYLLHAVSKTNTEILGGVIDTLREEGYSLGKLQ